MRTETWWTLLLASLLLLAPFLTPTLAAPAPLDNFVTNGDFELVAPAAVGDAVCTVTGDDDVPLPPEPAPPLVILNGCNAGAFKAVQWSSPPDTTFGDFTGDGSREARLGGSASHNLWQAYPNAQQAYSARMDHYAFQVKDSTLGSEGAWQVSPNAAVRLSLSTVPAESQHPFVGIYQECVLRWTGATMNGAIDAEGLVRLDPLVAIFQSTYTACDDAKAEWDAGDDDARLDLLGRLRIVQNSFWGFNAGGNVVIIDNVHTVGSTLAAEELAAGNLQV